MSTIARVPADFRGRLIDTLNLYYAMGKDGAYSMPLEDANRLIAMLAAAPSLPAEAVDVGAIREVIAELTKEYGLSYPFEIRCANKLHRAISNAPTPLREWDVPYEDYIRTLKTT